MAESIKLLKALSEPLRLRIVALVDQAALSVSELVKILGQSQSTISHHIKTLAELGLINVQKMGTQNLYSTEGSTALPPAFIELWQKREQLFGELAEYTDDNNRMLQVLSEREKRGFGPDWQSWRKVQPDLPYTFEVALRGLRPAGLAVDLGCGDGNFIEKITSAFDTVIGIDMATEQLQTAQNRQIAGNVQLLQGNAVAVPLAAESTDSVFFRMVLGFIAEPAQAISEASRILKTGGRMSIIDKSTAETTSFSLRYFQDICENQQNLRLAHFSELPHVFIAVLEKLN